MEHLIKCLTTMVFFLMVSIAQAGVLVAVNDDYGIPFNEPLRVEPLGVLENDTLDGESAGENGAVAEWVSGPGHGVMQCPSNTSLPLCPDGAFEYSPDASFAGSDSFVYQVVAAGSATEFATVTLTACNGGPEIYSCWHEASYLTLLADFAYVSFFESFEGDVWNVARSPDTAASVTSQGITWTSNFPVTNNITTGTGPARSGLYGMWDAQHGFATGTTKSCDVDMPPEHCLYHDGFSGSRVIAKDELHGVSGYVTGAWGYNVAIFLDGTTEVGLGQLPGNQHQFIGVVDASAAGFRSFEFRELNGKFGQALYVWGDDFTFAILPPSGNTTPVAEAGVAQTVLVDDTVVLDGSLSSDLDEDMLTYRWSFASVPVGSYPEFDTTDPVHPTFVTDLLGTYLVQLIVNDSMVDSLPDTVEITAGCSDDVVTVANATIPPGITICIASIALFAGPNLLIVSGAELWLDAPAVSFVGDVKVEAGAILRVQPDP